MPAIVAIIAGLTCQALAIAVSIYLLKRTRRLLPSLLSIGGFGALGVLGIVALVEGPDAPGAGFAAFSGAASVLLAISVALVAPALLAHRRSQAELRLSEDRYRNLFENAQVGIYRTTPDGRILAANPTLARMLGFSSTEDLMRRNLEKEGAGSGYERKQFKALAERPGGVRGIEAAWARQDGSAISIRENAVAVRDAMGNVLYYEGTVEDISARKAAEQALREANDALNALFQASPLAIIAYGQDGEVRLWNAAARRLFGYTAEEVVGRPFPLLPPAARSELDVDGQHATPRVVFGLEMRHNRKDGSDVDLLISAAALRAADGRTRGVMVVVADNTARKRAEEALRRSEDRYRQVVEQSPDGIVVHGDGRVLFANSAAATMLGFDSADALVDRPWLDLLPAVAAPDATPIPLSPGRPRTAVFRRRDLLPVNVEMVVRAIPFQDRAAEQVVFRDVTERKRAEALASRQAAMLAAHSRILEASLGAPDLGQLLTGIVTEARRLTGADAGSLFLRTGQELILQVRDGGPDPTVEVLVVPMTPLPPWAEDFGVSRECDGPGTPPCMRLPGRASWVSMPLRLPSRRDAADELVGVVILCSRSPDAFPDADVAALRGIAGQAALAIDHARAWREAQESRSLLENAVEGIYRIAANGRMVTANPSLARMLGYATPDELVRAMEGLPQSFFVDGERYKEFRETLAKDGVVLGFEYAARRKDGATVWVSENARATTDDQGRLKFYEGLLEDVTRRKELEQQLLQGQKMEALGRLAGGVAHDFNNLLTAILGYTTLLLEQFPAGSSERQSVEEIQAAGERAAALTGRLLVFSRRQVVEARPLDLKVVVAGMESLLRRVIGEHIELKTRLDRTAVWIKADASQIEQVLLNLAVNARDAMPDGGRLSIETHSVNLDAAFAEEHVSVVPGPHVMLAVSDTGYGMTPDVLAHVFEPFFTTKEPGRGTGLGLATVYGIVKQTGGTIWVQSEPARGTTFRIYFPRAATDTMRPPPPVTPGRSLRGTEQILLVEDEESVRTLTKRVLESQGYKVIAASSGQDALDKVRTAPKIDLIVSDVVMPGMSGRDLVERLRVQRPQVKVLYISGYTDGSIRVDEFLKSGAMFLQKPFAPERLAQVVRECIDGVADKSPR